VHAGAAYAGPLRGPLAARGAVLAVPLAHLRQGEQLAWYGRHPAGDSPQPRSLALPPGSAVEASASDLARSLSDLSRAPGHLTGSASGTAAAPSTVQDNHVTALHGPGEDRTSRPLIGPVPSFKHSPGDGIVGGDVPKRTVPSPGTQEAFQQGRGLTEPES
jgi:hypothetical protein